jgi:dsDNA-binding SOS-regulon protein
MNQFKALNSFLVDHHFAEEQMLLETQKNLMAYNKLLKSATVLLVFISQIEEFEEELKQELKSAIYQRAEKSIFNDLYTKIGEALQSHKEKRFPRS